jgi:hypothetical protein
LVRSEDFATGSSDSGPQKSKDPLGYPIAGLEGVALLNCAQLKKTSAPRQGMRMERMPQGIIVKVMLTKVRE